MITTKVEVRKHLSKLFQKIHSGAEVTIEELHKGLSGIEYMMMEDDYTKINDWRLKKSLVLSLIENLE